ncbi:hypothetical protein HJC23_008828 [Cyclotella cryptica]|uniref:SGNH hydrolase-type esterase domain-containing protein n=1 Tax=Cyclotella cryptica TaxID=29204 RepID=A0ABD3QFI0_9STRA|eukprot:CCRYP_007473-RA/>CCRYP_007473-RA protein AED:0.16 eAED:-0.03 QI:0/0/0/0.33/1/1/3/0/658
MSLRTPRLSPSRIRREVSSPPSPLSSDVHYANEKRHRSHVLGVVHPSFIKLALLALIVAGWTSLLLLKRQTHHSLYPSIRRVPRNNDHASTFTATHPLHQNPYALSPGELPGYTGWARPEQTLAGYFRMASTAPSSSSSHPQNSRYHSILPLGQPFTLLLHCLHDENMTYYACPPTGGAFFYVRAYGPSVITGTVVDHSNSSYLIALFPPEAGEYTVEVVVTFSAPLNVRDFPLRRNRADAAEKLEEEDEPGYEGYLVHGFPIFILVLEEERDDAADPLFPPPHEVDKPWCNLTQLTETSPLSSLTAGHWRVIDHVGRSIHHPLTPDEASVSLDGYRMGLNSLGVRMQYVYEECELMHIRDIVGDGRGHVMKACLRELGYLDEVLVEAKNQSGAASPMSVSEEHDNVHGVDVIFIGDSVMKLEMGFFTKLLGGSMTSHAMRGVNITYIETNGGIHSTLSNIIATLKTLQTINERGQSKKSGFLRKRLILFNSGLHDIDILCSSKRRRSRNVTITSVNNASCADAYRDVLMRLVQFIDAYPAEIKVFRTTTAGWPKYGNYGFTWPASEMQPQSRSTHTVNHFNEIAHDIIRKYSSSIYITDGYWITLPRPDHTQTSEHNQVGKHLVHPGYEVLSVFARKWLMLILWSVCGDSIMTGRTL